MTLSRRARLVLLTALVLAALGAAVLFTGDGAPLRSPFTSRPLARVHGHLEGEAHCADCHAPGGGVDEGRCLACHEPLAQRIAAGRGYHGQPERAGACNDCHSEHHGEDYALIRWPTPEAPFRPARAGEATAEQFPHAAGTAFELVGAHAKLACADCHATRLVVDPAVLAFAGTEHTFLGLAPDCAGCHADPHTPTLGRDCASCHQASAWKPAPGFDHAAARFPLEGEHAAVACEACHTAAPSGAQPAPPRPAALPSFEAVLAKAAARPFREGLGRATEPGRAEVGALPTCASCHDNPHRAEPRRAPGFASCAECHTPHGWPLAEEAPFDHQARTGFPLDGAHAQVSCAQCHGERLERAPRAACADCHEDPHRGAFAREMAVGRTSCDRCHGTERWEETPRYALEDHPLPLIEGHAVACERCHGQEATFPRLPARGGAPVGPLEQSCQACHQDPHQGRLANDCASCHGFGDFHLAQLDAEGHAALGFPIVGAHLQTSCEGCHGGRAPEGGLRRMALTEVRAAGCVACHEDPHRGQLARDCAQCHDEHRFTPSRYDEERHAQTRLPLLGAHQAIPCEVCHTRDLPGDVQRFRWEGSPSACATCHDDPHRGQFGEQSCADCHAPERFSPSSFGVGAHARLGFPLTGPHAVDCARCHVSGLHHGQAITWRGTPADCAGCHLDPHLGQFAGREGGCLGCHRPQDWTPTKFDHERSRFPLRGQHAALACDACHLSVRRELPGGGVREVVHYAPIEGRDCGDCHVNPHAAGKAVRGEGR